MSEKLTGEALEQALKDRGLPSEGKADEKRAAIAAYDEKNASSGSEPTGQTRLDDNVSEPSTTAPGDGPADTTDPNETAHSVTPSPSKEALEVGTVNAVLPGTPANEAAKPSTGKHRIEKYEATRPDGSVVTVTHNIDTGETSVS